MKVTKVIFDSGALPHLTPTETAQYEAERKILRTKEIPHGRLETMLAGQIPEVVREVHVFRRSPGNFYYRIIDKTVDEEGVFLRELAREGYDSNELRRSQRG